MNKMEKLIQELCPEGVERFELGDLAKVSTGQAPDEDWKSGTGQFPFINGGTSPSGYVRTSNTIGDTIVIPSRGSVGRVAYLKHEFWCGPLSYRIQSFDDAVVSNKFLFYSLKNSEDEIVALQQSGSIPALNKKELVSVRIAVPHFQVQQEIVSTLEKFTQLEAELEAELEARNKQFSFFCNQMFSETYSKNLAVPIGTLGELGDFRKGSGLQKSDFSEDGEPCIHYGQIHTRFGSRTSEALTKAPATVTNRLRVANPGDLIIADTAEDFGGVAKATAWLGDNPIAVGGHTLIYSHRFDSTFISYFFRSASFQDQKNRLAKGVKVKDISSTAIAKIRVPFPDMETQRRIGSALSQLDDLVGDSPDGLLGEIQARRKQYEHYRNKLLTFKELDAA